MATVVRRVSRRDEILDALIGILKDKGVQSDFTLSELAQHVDIAKSTIYEYFRTKEEILSDALLRVFKDGIESILMRTYEESKEFEELLKDEIRFMFDMAQQSGFVFEFIGPELRADLPSHLKGQFVERMQETNQHYEKLFRQILAKGIEQGVLKAEDLEIRGHLFAALIAGSITRFANVTQDYQEPIDLDNYVDAFYDLVVKLFN